MSTALHLAKPGDIDRLAALVAAYHTELGFAQDHAERRGALAPLLDGVPHGAAYLVGPARAPIGYVILGFGWSVAFGGLIAHIDEIYFRRAVRGRGIATEVLSSLPKTLAAAGVRALHLDVDSDDEAARRLYARAGFAAHDDRTRMSRIL